MGTSVGGRASSLRPTWVEIDLGALGRNFRAIRDLVAPRRVWCVVKADGYGHGAVEVSRRFQKEGAEAFVVATVDEGVELRLAGIAGDILVAAGIAPVRAGNDAAQAAVEHGLAVAVYCTEAAAALGEAVRQVGQKPAGAHLKVDTGMGRLGVAVDESPGAAVQMARQVATTDGVELQGLFSSLAVSEAAPDEPRNRHNVAQFERFERLCAALDEAGLLPEHRHLGNSGAILRHEAAWLPDWCTGVRPGLALYGMAPFSGAVTVALQPVMSWHSAVASIREVPEGWPLGYGGVRRAARDSRIAVVPVGYHDGLPRSLSEKAELLVCGRRATVVGAISMDLTLVDITDISDVRVGSPVTLIGTPAGPGGDAIRTEELARNGETIPWEILCRVGGRVPRRFTDSSP